VVLSRPRFRRPRVTRPPWSTPDLDLPSYVQGLVQSLTAIAAVATTISVVIILTRSEVSGPGPPMVRGVGIDSDVDIVVAGGVAQLTAEVSGMDPPYRFLWKSVLGEIRDEHSQPIPEVFQIRGQVWWIAPDFQAESVVEVIVQDDLREVATGLKAIVVIPIRAATRP